MKKSIALLSLVAFASLQSFVQVALPVSAAMEARTQAAVLVSAKSKNAQSEALQSGTWSLATLNGKEVAAESTVEFKNREYHAKACNVLNGKYRAVGNRLVLRNGISTMMYCEGEPMDIERALSFAYAKYSVKGDVLTIETSKGDALVWERK